MANKNDDLRLRRIINEPARKIGATTVQNVADMAASFQEAVVEVIVNKAISAAREFGQNRIVMAGGVASNSRLREMIREEGEKYGIQVMQPRPLYCTDNGVMIACSAYYKMKKGEFAGPDLDAIPGLEF